MTHPTDTNYIIIQTADGFELPESYGTQSANDQSGAFCMIDDRSGNKADDIGYTPGGAYPSWVTDVCPNAPDCTYAEAKALVATHGASGETWSVPLE